MSSSVLKGPIVPPSNCCLYKMDASAAKIQAFFRGSVARRLKSQAAAKLARGVILEMQVEAYDIDQDCIIKGLEERRLTRGFKGPLFSSSSEAQ
mmetsp:Transcript_6662/g.11774  ORF Transcript_6662/g.11774 Transcript_6662/m.11774 type:complete len:94 (+) Transcript_6662:2280-2561(+)